MMTGMIPQVSALWRNSSNVDRDPPEGDEKYVIGPLICPCMLQPCALQPRFRHQTMHILYTAGDHTAAKPKTHDGQRSQTSGKQCQISFASLFSIAVGTAARPEPRGGSNHERHGLAKDGQCVLPKSPGQIPNHSHLRLTEVSCIIAMIRLAQDPIEHDLHGTDIIVDITITISNARQMM